MEGFVFSDVRTGDENVLMNGCYIIVLQCVRIPPHLLFAVNGKTWSLSVSGQQTREPLEKLLAYIKRKQVPTVFSSCKLPQDFSIEKMEEILSRSVRKYDQVKAGEVSCLYPIRDAMAEVFGPEMHSARFIFELIPLLEKKGAMEANSGFFIEEYLDKQNNFTMQVYSALDVDRATNQANMQFSDPKD